MRKPRPLGARVIELVPGLVLPEYMGFIMERCRPTGYTKKAIDAGDALLVDYLPGYLEFVCSDVEKLAEEAKRRGLRVYKGRSHLTITDGVYPVCIYPAHSEDTDNPKAQQPESPTP
ncbi:hypothetical protein [Pyrodictium abyssi]|uniref:Uncharacterized protein n=1 Tax=Pyrodictium abyssi TaxID=54256 RepID=A0ABM8ISP1_9CREN|nr:hypothetical protein PABY_01440 [Pyrodictium abyssi]